MNCTPRRTFAATSDSAYAALIRPAVGFRSAYFNPHAPIFVRLSMGEVGRTKPTAVIESIRRSWEGTWLFTTRCPYCKGLHRHGGGNGPEPYFGNRFSDCAHDRGGTYDLVAVEAVK